MANAELVTKYKFDSVDTDGNTIEVEADIDMNPWPRKSYLILLDEPLKRFDPQTGEPEPFSYIVLTVPEDGEGKIGEEAYIFPSDERANFVDKSMVPMRRLPAAAFPHSILASIGYTLT